MGRSSRLDGRGGVGWGGVGWRRRAGGAGRGFWEGSGGFQKFRGAETPPISILARVESVNRIQSWAMERLEGEREREEGWYDVTGVRMGRWKSSRRALCWHQHTLQGFDRKQGTLARAGGERLEESVRLL